MIIQTPTFYQRQDSTTKTVSFAAVAKLSALDPQERNLLDLAMDLLPEGSDVYTQGQVRRITLHGIRCGLTEDSATISFSVATSSAEDGVQMLVSLLEQPSFQENSIPEGLARLSSPERNFWKREVEPRPFGLKTATRQELLDTFHRIFKLDGLRVGVVSAKPVPRLTEIWDNAVTDWPKAPEEDLRFDTPFDLAFPDSQPATSTASIIGPELPATPPDLAAQVLALYALGVGKTSSLFRVCREQHAWSYFQEGFLEPTLKGWTPRLFISMAPNPENRKRMDQLQTELQTDVASWTPELRASALGMAEANLDREVPYGPFLVQGESLNDDQEQRLVWNLYWLSKTGVSWSSRELLSDLDKVDLETLKATAIGILKPAKIHYLPAEK